MQTFKLKNQFHIRGELITEIQYDFNEFTGSDYLAISDAVDESKSSRLSFYLTSGILIASNRDKKWTPEDFLPLKGTDLIRFLRIGKLFTESADDTPQDDSSDAPSASTPSASTPPSET